MFFKKILILIYFVNDFIDLYNQGGKHFFTAIKEGDELKFATDDENERHLWVQALYRATGQAYKPVPPKQSLISSKAQGFADKASKHGLDELIQADPVMLNHDHLFAKLQTFTLEYRLGESICSLVTFLKTNFVLSLIKIIILGLVFARTSICFR